MKKTTGIGLTVVAYFGMMALMVSLTPEKANSSVPPPRVGFRVEDSNSKEVVIRPIYPAKFGVTLLEGEAPKKDELLTCYIREEFKVEGKSADGQPVVVNLMVMNCLTGQKFVIRGVKW